MSSVRIEVRGFASLARKVARLPAAFRKPAVLAVKKSTLLVHGTVGKSIQRGPKTGKVYDWRGAAAGETPDRFLLLNGRIVPVVNRTTPHQASAPGQPPASDTGRLASSVLFAFEDGGLTGVIIARTDYASYLEFGTRFMEPRPFMRPGLRKNEEAILRFVEQGVEQSLNEFKYRGKRKKRLLRR